ncbi:histidine phosphatase family protein [Nocardioides zeae]|uniref:Histidine phosphatase family protein n=1 Tax=Nocardioides imazamoxiresistens TaxID=3231893 RepID=A0ABU3PUM5_9ACTN|nr:histidine phosphatase family protein [Nocardioides zeae]MDT9592874.1 histidine phosphatase family protein [Nocardioides zeae]
MGTLLLVRHGQATWESGDEDTLSPLGWEQSRLLGGALASRGVTPDIVVRGTLGTQRETTEGLVEAAGWTPRVVVDERWDEYDRDGVLRDRIPTMVGGGAPEPQQFQQWMQAAMLRWTSGEHHDYGESFADFALRTHGALLDAADRAGSTSTVVVVTSGGPIAWLTAALIGLWAPELPPSELAGAWSRLHPVVVNSSVTKVTVGLRGVRLVSFNEHTHLEAGPCP